MKLHFRSFGSGEPLIIMHGVFGSADNWQTLGKVFSETHKVYLVDLRNHGNSPHNDLFTYESMVEDIVELMGDEGFRNASIVGHSMGGKVAMHLATQHPEKVNKLIVVDIAPKYYPPHHQEIFNGFRSVDLSSLQNRKDADEQMSRVISNFGVRQFILKNLERTKEGTFQWKLNIDAIERAIENIGQGLESEVHFPGKTLFIAGSKSDYITPEDHATIQRFFPDASIATVLDAGHWVHAEKPLQLSELVMEFLAE